MSRIGKRPIEVPAGVLVSIDPGRVTVSGPKGELRQDVPQRMQIAQEDGTVTITRPTERGDDRALHGLTRTLIANMVEGVTNGYRKALEIQGVGFKAEQKGKNLVLSVGYANQITVPIPGNVTVALDGANKVVVTGADKQAVGEFAAQVRSVRKPEPYKGKGIRYEGEQVKIKPGKAFAGAGAK